MAISLATEAARAGKLAVQEHNKRECKLLETVKVYADAQDVSVGAAAASALTTALAGHKVLKVLLHHTVGGAAAEDVTLTGVVATDIVSAVLASVGSTPVTIVTAKAATGKVTITFSGNPADDHTVNLIVMRPSA